MGSGSENPPHSPETQTPSSVVVVSIKELLRQIREKHSLRDYEGYSFINFRVPPEVHVAYKALSPGARKAIKDGLVRTIALADLGYIDLEESPTLIVRKEAPALTVEVEEVRRSELEERLKSYEKLVEELRKEVKNYKDLAVLYEERLKSRERELEELRKKCDPLKDRQLKRAVELIRMVLEPSVDDFARSPTKRDRFRTEATAFLNSLAGQV